MTTAPHLPPCQWPIVDRESLCIAADYAAERMTERAAAEWVLRECGLDSDHGVTYVRGFRRSPAAYVTAVCGNGKGWFRYGYHYGYRQPDEPLLAFVTRAICEIRGW